MALAGMVWLLSACGMFQIRDAVAPSSVGTIPERTPTSPENVLFNFASAVSHGTNGLVLYDRSLADDFRLQLDEVDQAEMSLLELNKAQDLDAHRRFITDAPDSIAFEFGEAPKDERETTALFEDIPYEMSFLSLEEGAWVEVESLFVAGTIKLTLVKGQDATWSIQEWIDQRVENATSFGRVHAEHALQAPRPATVLD